MVKIYPLQHIAQQFTNFFTSIGKEMQDSIESKQNAWIKTKKSHNLR